MECCEIKDHFYFHVPMLLFMYWFFNVFYSTIQYLWRNQQIIILSPWQTDLKHTFWWQLPQQECRIWVTALVWWFVLLNIFLRINRQRDGFLIWFTIVGTFPHWRSCIKYFSLKDGESYMLTGVIMLVDFFIWVSITYYALWNITQSKRENKIHNDVWPHPSALCHHYFFYLSTQQ